MKKFLYLAFFAFTLLLVSPSSTFAQELELGNAELLERLQGGKGNSANQPSVDEGYKSFVQNEYSNVFKQLSEIEPDDMEKINRANLNEKRLRLASDLCAKDSRACFLIDAYREYQNFTPEITSPDDLKLFGTDIFAGYTNEFNFYDSLSVSDDYIIKIGDVLNVYLYGGLDINQEFKVDNQGSILVEGLGSISLAGLSFSSALKKVEEILNDQYVGTEAIISLQEIKSKQVFILGNIRSPGTFALNAFSTPLNALISAGGIKPNSSLRNVSLLRDGSEYLNVDFYDLLVNGDSSKLDSILKDGDTMLVNGIKSSVSIYGEVIRPAVYEFKEGETLENIISFALGVSPFADMRSIAVTRMLPSGQKTILNPVDAKVFKIENGDVIKVNASNGQVVDFVSLNGSIRNPREFPHRDGLVLGNLIRLESDLLANTYTGFALIKRLNFASRAYSYVGFSLTNQALINTISLNSGDQVYFFAQEDIQFLQSHAISSYFEQKAAILSPNSSDQQDNLSDLAQIRGINLPETSTRSSFGNGIISNANSCLYALDALMGRNVVKSIYEKTKVFSYSSDKKCTQIFNDHPDLLPISLVTSIPVTGNVRFPGIYPIAKDLSALNLFYIAGGFLYPNYDNNPEFEVGVRPNTFLNVSSGNLASTTDLIFFKPQLKNSATDYGYVQLIGEFENPGTYQISKGTKLSEIYKRAGGLTSYAYPLGGILSRDSIKESEAKALSRAKAELSQILASAVASGYLKQNSTDLIGLVSLMSDITDSEPAGRLVAELNPNLISRSPIQDLDLEGGDIIYMPPIQNTVTVVGQVLNPVTVPYSESLRSNDYVKFAGGFQTEADKKRMYIILPNGKSAPVSMSILERGPFSKNNILPGSTIIIPRKSRPMDSLALVETISPIIASLSVTAASIAAIQD